MLVLMVHLEPQELKEFQVRAGVWDLKENLEKKETQDYGVLVGALNHQVQFIHTGDGSLVVVMSPLFTKVCIKRQTFVLLSLNCTWTNSIITYVVKMVWFHASKAHWWACTKACWVPYPFLGQVFIMVLLWNEKTPASCLHWYRQWLGAWAWGKLCHYTCCSSYKRSESWNPSALFKVILSYLKAAQSAKVTSFYL